MIAASARPSLPLRQKIVRMKKSAIRYALLNATGVAASVVAVEVSGWPSYLLILTGLQAVPLLLNSYAAIRAHQALRIYDANPAAAYLSEVRHAFR